MKTIRRNSIRNSTRRNNNYRRKNEKKGVNIQEVIVTQFIVCGILLLCVLAINLIEVDFTNKLSKDLKVLITQNIDIKDYNFDDISKKFKSTVHKVISSKFKNIKQEENNYVGNFRIDEDILSEIREIEKLYHYNLEKK